MFHEIRRKDRQLTNTESMAILEKAEYGIFSTIGVNGYPYGVPVNYVLKDNSIYFHCALNEGHKLDNLKNSNRVSFCVVGDVNVIPSEFSTKYESVIVFGRATELKGEAKNEALVNLLNKYSPGFIDKGEKYINNDGEITAVIKIDIEHLTGKANK